MDTLATALVMAVQYIADRDESMTEDDDVDMLESIGRVLQSVGDRERDSLISAAHRLKLPEWPTQIGLMKTGGSDDF